jgi:hypothetical protein
LADITTNDEIFIIYKLKKFLIFKRNKCPTDSPTFGSVRAENRVYYLYYRRLLGRRGVDG